jgi:hypothetical protein
MDLVRRGRRPSALVEGPVKFHSADRKETRSRFVRRCNPASISSSYGEGGAELSRFCAPLLITVSGVPPTPDFPGSAPGQNLAAYHRVPAIYFLREFAVVGWLMSYGTIITDAGNRPLMHNDYPPLGIV